MKQLSRLILALTTAVVLTIGAHGVTFAADNQMAALYGPSYASTCYSLLPPPSPTTFGFVNFHVQDGTILVNDHLKDASPNTTYRVDLWSGAPGACTLQVLGYVTTNSNGVGNGTFTGTLTGPTFSLTNFNQLGTGDWLLSTPTQTVS